MDPEIKAMADVLQDENSRAIVVGNEVVFPPWQVGGKPFHFDAYQTRFLYALQKNGGDLEKACRFIQKPMDWANKFIASRKFREFRNAKLSALAVRNGDLVEWWWEYGMDGAKGFRECYEGACHLCHEKNLYRPTEAEITRDDDMKLNVKCKVCLQGIDVDLKREEFKPSREQVQFWSELGNRLSPKIERVQHSFSKEIFSFGSGESE